VGPAHARPPERAADEAGSMSADNREAEKQRTDNRPIADADKTFWSVVCVLLPLVW